jgi:hypothetical protein
MDINLFNKSKERARIIYNNQKTIYCPYFKDKIILNSDGFHHLQFSARRERNKEEQLLKFNLLLLGIRIIKNSGTLQEYRKNLIPIGRKGKDGLSPMKQVEYWGFIAIVGENRIKVKVIVRRIGDGNIVFWSIMPYSKLKNQKLYTDGIEDEE